MRVTIRQSSEVGYPAETVIPRAQLLRDAAGGNAGKFFRSRTFNGQSLKWLAMGRARACATAQERSCSAAVESQTFRIGSATRPRNFVVAPTATGFSASWRSPRDAGGTVRRYNVQWRLRDATLGAWNGTSDNVTQGVSARAPYMAVHENRPAAQTWPLLLGREYLVRAAAVTNFRAEGMSSDFAGTWTREIPVLTGFHAPGAPRNVTAVAMPTSIRLAWQPPASDGGKSISGYLVRRSIGAGTSNWDAPGGVATGSTATNYVMQNLIPASAYEIEIAAVNSQGRGAWSATARVTTLSLSPPSAPTGLGVTPAGAQLNIRWAAPADDGGGINGYRYRWSNDGNADTWESAGGGAGVEIPNSAGATSAAIMNIALNQTYVVQVAAFNSAGSGAWSNSVTARSGLPLAPNGLRANSENGAVALVWSAPTISVIISGYRYRWSNNGDDNTWESSGGGDGAPIAGSATATDYTIASLTNGTLYHVQLAAENASGTGAWSASVNATPLGAPGQPGVVTAKSVDGGLVLRWQAPAELGGAALSELRYEVRWRLLTVTSFGGAVEIAAGETSHRLSGLNNDVEYVVQVRAVNSARASDWGETRHTPRAFTLDVDGDENASATDGLLIARYLLGLRGADLLANLDVPADADAAAIASKLGGNLSKLDIDNSGATTAADGIIIARYLLGVESGAGLRDGQTTMPEAVIRERITAIMP
ncbi:MAG: fibronectin type III domain-containing protein [Gammaproteobacteria bacterium]